MSGLRNVFALDCGVPLGAEMACVYDASRKRYRVPTNAATLSCGERILSRIANFFSSEPVAVLDTGMLSKHPWLRRRIVDAVDFTGEGPEDRNGHGTAVALIFLANSPGARLLNVKVLGWDKLGTEEDLIAGLRWAEEHRATAVNLSLGIQRKCDGRCAVCSEANRISRKGILITAAAGNFGLCCPARAEGIFSVGGSPTIEFGP